METFSCRTKLVCGAGALAALGELGIGRLLLVADPYFVKNGWAQRVAALSGAAVEIFDRVQPDPTVELAAEGVAALRAFAPDAVAALGGGSTIDCAKAMVHFAGQPVRLIAIPTTSGSGSEVTDFAVLTHKGVKHPLIDACLQPELAILDSDLLKELPQGLVADCGFDILAHALEAYTATGAGMVSDTLALEAFCAAFANLPASFAGKTAVRQKLHTASCMAGMAFSQAGLGLCHAMAHAIGGQFHIPHGRLNAILLPSVIACNAHGAGEKYAKLARAAGLGGSAESIGVRSLKNGLIRLRRELGLPQTLLAAGIRPQAVRQQARAIVEATLQDPCCRTNPVLVEDFMVRRILEEVTGRI